MTTKKSKGITFRQQLRDKGEERLKAIKGEIAEALDIICKREQIEWMDLAKVSCAGSHKTAEHNLVTQLANKHQADLEKIYNDQQKLDLGDEGGE